MANVLALEKTSISSNCTSMVVTDITGNYNASTNLGGYGAPNDTRVSLYLKLLVNLRKSTGREVIAVPAYNENTATTWTITIAEDGWYELYLFACKVWDAAITYALSAVVYSVATDSYYKSIQAGNLNNAVTNTTWWTAITTDVNDYLAAVALPQTATYEVTKNVVELCSSRKCEAQMLLKANCDCCDECMLQEYEKVRMKIEGAGWNEALGNFTEAQEIVENLNTICGELEDCNCH